MKAKDTIKTAVWMPMVLLLAVTVGIVQAAAEKSPTVLFQEALYQEETEGDLDKAIELYGQVLDEAAEVKHLAARSLYQLGMCHLKKGEKDAAADYFRQVVNKYAKQTSVAKKAKSQLAKIAPEEIGGGLYEQATQAVWTTLSSMYGQVCAKAGAKNLYTNSNIHFVNSDFVSWYGGYGFYTNGSNETVSGRVQLGGTSYPNQKHYDVMGNPLETEIVQNGKNHYDIYLNLPQELVPGQFYPYAWATEGSKKLQAVPFNNDKYQLKMQNHFGSRALEIFFLVVPSNLVVEYEEKFIMAENGVRISTETTDKATAGDYNIYAWTKEVQPNDNHVVTVYLSKKRDVSPKELKAIVEKAVLTISTCAETDPRVKKSLTTLDGLDEQAVVQELNKRLDAKEATVRRSAIYILWKGGFNDISASYEMLRKHCGHEEEYTRGMTALTLGEAKDIGAYDILEKMTLDDESAFARRCGAYALGQLGDPKAVPVLKKALKDDDFNVRNNAEAAITTLTQLKDLEKKPNTEEQLRSAFIACGTLCDSIRDALANDDFQTAESLCKQVEKQINDTLPLAVQSQQGTMFESLASQFNVWHEAIKAKDKEKAVRLGEALNHAGGLMSDFILEKSP